MRERRNIGPDVIGTADGSARRRCPFSVSRFLKLLNLIALEAPYSLRLRMVRYFLSVHRPDRVCHRPTCAIHTCKNLFRRMPLLPIAVSSSVIILLQGRPLQRGTSRGRSDHRRLSRHAKPVSAGDSSADKQMNKDHAKVGFNRALF